MKQIILRNSKILLDIHLSRFYSIDLFELRKILEQNKDKFDSNSYFNLTIKDISTLRKNLIINDIEELNESHIAFEPSAVLQLSFYLNTSSAKYFRQVALDSFKNFVVDNINYSIIRHFDGNEELIEMMSLMSDRKENSQIGFKIKKNLNS